MTNRCSPSPGDSACAHSPANAAAAEPVAGSSTTPSRGANIRAWKLFLPSIVSRQKTKAELRPPASKASSQLASIGRQRRMASRPRTGTKVKVLPTDQRAGAVCALGRRRATDDADLLLEHDVAGVPVAVEREDERGADGRVAGKRQLDAGREDAHARGAARGLGL